MSEQGKTKTFSELLAALEELASRMEAEIAARKAGGKASEVASGTASESRTSKK